MVVFLTMCENDYKYANVQFSTTLLGVSNIWKGSSSPNAAIIKKIFTVYTMVETNYR